MIKINEYRLIKIECDSCKYKAMISDKEIAFKIASAHNKGKHMVRAQWYQKLEKLRMAKTM